MDFYAPNVRPMCYNIILLFEIIYKIITIAAVSNYLHLASAVQTIFAAFSSANNVAVVFTTIGVQVAM